MGSCSLICRSDLRSWPPGPAGNGQHLWALPCGRFSALWGHQSTMNLNVPPVGWATEAVKQGLPMPRRVWGVAGRTVLKNHPVSSRCGRLCSCPPLCSTHSADLLFPHWTQTSQPPQPTPGGDVAILDPGSLAPPPGVTKISLNMSISPPKCARTLPPGAYISEFRTACDG